MRIFCVYSLVLFFAVLFCPVSFVEAAEDDDIFVDVYKELKVFNAIGEESETPGYSCYNMYGVELKTYYKKETHTPEFVALESDETKKASVSFNDATKELDIAIEKSVDGFAQSGAACSSTQLYLARKQLDIIIEKREALLPLVLAGKAGKEYSPETDEKDARSFIYGESKDLFTKFSTGMAELKKTLSGLSTTNLSDSFSKYSFAQTEKQKNERMQRATKRGNEIVQEFAGSITDGIYDPLYSARSSITSSLGGLPNGRSNTISLPKILAENIANSLAEKKHEYLLDQEGNLNELMTAQVSVLQTVESDMAEYNKRFAYLLSEEEKISQFDDSLSGEIVNSLGPFHRTLLETEVILQGQEKALESVLNRQNIGVE